MRENEIVVPLTLNTHNFRLKTPIFVLEDGEADVRHSRLKDNHENMKITKTGYDYYYD